MAFHSFELNINFVDYCHIKQCEGLILQVHLCLSHLDLKGNDFCVELEEKKWSWTTQLWMNRRKGGVERKNRSGFEDMGERRRRDYLSLMANLLTVALFTTSIYESNVTLCPPHSYTHLLSSYRVYQASCQSAPQLMWASD